MFLLSPDTINSFSVFFVRQIKIVFTKFESQLVCLTFDTVFFHHSCFQFSIVILFLSFFIVFYRSVSYVCEWKYSSLFFSLSDIWRFPWPCRTQWFACEILRVCESIWIVLMIINFFFRCCCWLNKWLWFRQNKEEHAIRTFFYK